MAAQIAIGIMKGNDLNLPQDFSITTDRTHPSLQIYQQLVTVQYKSSRFLKHNNNYGPCESYKEGSQKVHVSRLPMTSLRPAVINIVQSKQSLRRGTEALIIIKE